MSLHQLKSKKSSPRSHLGIETDSCRLKKLGQSFVNFNAMPAKITKTLLRLVLPDEICLVSSRHTAVTLQEHIICV